MNFTDYFASGEEEPFEESNQNTQVIDEGLVDVVFKTLKTALKTSVKGPLVFFKWEWMQSKTFFTLRIKKKTLIEFHAWLGTIIDEAHEQ